MIYIKKFVRHKNTTIKRTIKCTIMCCLNSNDVHSTYDEVIDNLPSAPIEEIC